jgi:hypothetical protein
MRRRDGVAAARNIMEWEGRRLGLIYAQSGPARAAVNGQALARENISVIGARPCGVMGVERDAHSRQGLAKTSTKAV